MYCVSLQEEACFSWYLAGKRKRDLSFLLPAEYLKKEASASREVWRSMLYQFISQ